MSVWDEIDAKLAAYAKQVGDLRAKIERLLGAGDMGPNVLVECDEFGWWRAAATYGFARGVDKPTCDKCGHTHAGVAFAFICVGCPCDARPAGIYVKRFQARTPEGLIAEVRK